MRCFRVVCPHQQAGEHGVRPQRDLVALLYDRAALGCCR